MTGGAAPTQDKKTLEAAEKAGGEGGTVAYLLEQARVNPGQFLALLGKVLPMQVNASGKVELKWLK